MKSLSKLVLMTAIILGGSLYAQEESAVGEKANSLSLSQPLPRYLGEYVSFSSRKLILEEMRGVTNTRDRHVVVMFTSDG